MPIDVDEAERLAEIARATIDVAGERGSRGVTLRSVAEQLGRSTMFITNFVPSRAQLIVNALEFAQTGWNADRAQRLGDTAGVERLAEVSRWMCSSTDDDRVLRALWIEAIADIRETAAARDIVVSVTDQTYGEFLWAARESGLAEAERIADALYLFCRGFHVKSVEDPQSWTDERATAAVEELLNALVFRRSPLAQQAVS